MITYGSTTLTSYNTITKIEVYYYKSTSATSLSGGSWSTTKPTWENGKYIWQKIRTTYEGKLENGQFYSESDPVNITGQQGATGTAAYSYKLNASDTTVTVSKIGVYSVNKITFTATSKQGTGSVNAYAGRFKIETTVNGTTWTTSYTSSGNESSKEFTIPTDIIAIRCSLYQAGGTSTLLDIMTIPILNDDRPIATKTYTGLIGSANDAANASFYFAKIHPDNYTTNYKVKMKVRVTAPEAYAETIDIQFGGYGSTFSSFDAYTTRTGSIGVYYINLYRATQAGISTNHKGHALGIGLRSSTNPTSTSYKRTIIVDILELDGCTVEMLDTAVKYASIDGTGSTNYYGLTEMAVGTAGQNATNNTNTHYTQYSNNVKAGTNGIKGYTLIMKDSENTWSCFYSGAYKKENTGKTVYTGGFMLGKILYSAGAGAQTSDSSLDTYYNYKSGVNTSTIYDAYPVDLRYSTNCASTLTSQRPVYIVGTIENDGLFHLDVSQWYTQTEPTYADGKVYVYVGMAYSTYQVWLSTENPAYMFYNGEFILYDKAQTLQNINTLKNSLETQIDSKVETWCQKTNPASSWTAEERPNHTGDLWYYIGESGTTYKNNTTYQYNGETNVWSAYSANPDLFDKIDGKTAIYYETTSGVTSAEEGDYLVDSENDCTYRWNDGAWVLATDYKQVAIDAVEIGGRNFLSKVNVLAQATQYTEENYVYTGLYGNGGGLKFPASIFEVGINYVLSFKFQKINGTLTAIGGHCTGFSSFGNKFVIDGIKEENRTYSQGHLMSDDTNVHSVEVYLTFNGNTSDNNLYIQPNRGAYTQANNNEFQIWDLQLEKGNQKTDWRPAPEDITRGTGFYAITTAPTAYTTKVGEFTPSYRVALSTVKSESGLEEVMVGDVIQQGYNTYPVGYVDASYVYLGMANSIRGASGTPGLNTARVILYRRFASAPTGTNVAPTGDVTYTFSTGIAANNLNSWTQAIPSGTDPVYMIVASASSTGTTDTIPKTEWSAPVKILENGTNGNNGTDGYNQATIYLYQRKSGTAPSKPSSAVTYTFSTGALSSVPTGWSRTIPTNDGNPCYVTTATAVAKTTTYSIPASGWSDVVILSQDGEDGVSVTNVTSTNNTADGGTSVVTITLSDGTTKTFNVKNGTKGTTGATAQWYYGTSLTHTSGTATLVATSTSGAVVGSMYLNTQTSLVYKCTAVGTNNTWTYAGDLTTGVIDNLEIGGRNLLLGSAQKIPVHWSTSAQNGGIFNVDTNVEVSEWRTKDAYRIYGQAGSTSKLFGLLYGIPFTSQLSIQNQSYTFSIFVKNQADVDFLIGTNSLGDYISIAPGESKRVVATVIGNGSSNIQFTFSAATNGGSYDVILWHPKIEFGNKVTDWTPAPEDTQAGIDTALAQSVEYIIGTQTAATGTWTGKTVDKELKVGKTIAYKLPYSGSGNASLVLTLADNTTTNAIAVYLNTTRVTTHFGAGSVINMTYDGQYWRASSIPNTNNYDRRQHSNAITAKTAITAKHLIVGDSTGYQQITSTSGGTLEFDLGYPILWAYSDIAATKTSTATYEAYPSVNFSTSGTIQNGATNKMLWLKGTIRGNIFTLASTNFLTTRIPTSDDGMYYIPLGIMSSTTAGYFSSSNRIYAYIDEEFQPLDNAAALKASSAYETAVQARSEIVQTQQTLSLQIRDISVGGANLFEKTKTFEGIANQSTAKDSFTEFVYKDLTVKSANTITFNNQVVELSAYEYTDLTSNMWYSFSFYAKGNVDIGFMYAGTGNAVIDNIDVSWNDNTYTGFNTTSTSSNIIWLTPTNNWQRYSVVFHIEEQDITALHRLIGLYARPVSSYTELATDNKDILITETGTDVHLIMEGNEVQICGYKLELGNKPTDWTPADNDKATYDNIISQINLSKEGIAIRADKIRLEGMITANEGFSIDEYGNMTANNGTFNGIFESYATEINENTFDLSINNGHIQFYNNDRTLTEDERYVGYIGGIRKNTNFIEGTTKNNDAITIGLYNNSDFLINAYDDTTPTPICEVLNYVTGKPTFDFWVPARIYDGNKLQMYSRNESHSSQIEFRRYSKNTGGYVSRGSLSLHSIQDNSDISDRLYLLSKNQGNDLAGDQFLYFAGKGLRYSSSGQPMRTGYVATDKYIVTQYFSLPDLTIVKNTSQNFTINVSRDGYTPIMCIPKVGGGQNAFYLSIYTWSMSGNIVTIRTHNNSSTSDVSNVTISLQVLYKLTY